MLGKRASAWRVGHRVQPGTFCFALFLACASLGCQRTKWEIVGDDKWGNADRYMVMLDSATIPAPEELIAIGAEVYRSKPPHTDGNDSVLIVFKMPDTRTQMGGFASVSFKNGDHDKLTLDMGVLPRRYWADAEKWQTKFQNAPNVSVARSVTGRGRISAPLDEDLPPPSRN